MNTTPSPELTLYQRLSQTGSDTQGLVTSAGAEFGIPDGHMNKIGMVESGLKSGAKNSKSSASGLYQFTKGTWNEVLGKYGAQYGIPEGTSAMDPTANAILGAAYLKENGDTYRNTYGKDPEVTDLYLGHFLGQTGRKRFMDGMNSNPDAPAVNFVKSNQANSNKEIFFDETGAPRSSHQVYELFGNKLGAVADAGSNSQLQGDMYVDAIKDREMGRQLLGQESQLNAELEVSKFRNSGLDVPLASGTAQPFGDTVASYGLNTPKEPEPRGFLDETWEVTKANIRLSAPVVKANEFVAEGLQAIANDFDLDHGWEGEAQIVADIFSDMSPEERQQVDLNNLWKPSADHIEAAVAAGIDRKWIEYLSTSMTPDEFVRKTQLASEMQKADKVRSEAGLGAGLLGGVAGAVVDPLTYIGGAAKGATWGSKLLFSGAEAAAGNVLSEKMTEWSTEGGVKADIAGAAIGGFVAGAGMRGLSEKFLNNSATTRMRARQESIATGAEDMTKRPDIEIPEGKTYADIPNEEGAVVDALGNTHSATSVGNPKLAELAEAEDIRANKGVDLGPASMLSMALLRAESKETRGIAADLVRSPTGIEGGGTGKSSMTAEDVIGRLEGQDNMWYVKANKQRDALVDIDGVGKDALQRDIVAAIESGDLSKLSPESRAFAESTIELYTRKFDEATNVGRFGNADAPPVFSSTRDPSRYVPQVFEEGKVKVAKQRFGGKEGHEGLQEAIKDNWVAQWKGDHNGVQAKFKDAYADDIAKLEASGVEHGDAVTQVFKDYIEKKSYGISRNGEFTHAGGIEDANLSDSLVGIENNNFTSERNVFDSGFESLAADGNPFAMNDLRHFDLMNIAQMYNRRMNGDVAIHASTGKDTKALKDRIASLPEGADKRNLDQLTRAITGRSRVENMNPRFNAAMRGLQNVAFASNNAQMWVNNLSEVTGWASNRLTFVMRNGVKGLNQLLNPEAKFTKADMKDFQSAMFGNDLNTIMTKSFANTRDSMERHGVGGKLADITAGIDQAGAVLASNKYNPYTRMLNATQEFLTNTARGGVLADVTNEAFGGVKFRPEILKLASITPDQHKGIMDMLRTHVKQVNGEFKPDVNAIVKDPRSNDLWRLADYIASDSVTRTNKVGMNYVQQPNALMNLALQFKSFTLKGLNSRTVRMFHETFQGKGLDNAVRVATMYATMNALWAMQTHYRSLGVPEKDRQAYLDKMLDPAMVSYQAVSRSAELGPLLGGFGLVANPVLQAFGQDGDLFRAGRSTIDPRSVALPRDPLRSNAGNLRDRMGTVGNVITDTIPAARTLVGAQQAVSAGVGIATKDYGYQKDMEKRAFFEGLGSLAPNDPAVQWLINQWAEQSGASGKNVQ